MQKKTAPGFPGRILYNSSTLRSTWSYARGAVARSVSIRSSMMANTARDQMGHSSVQVTQEIYTHLDVKYKAKKMEALDGYLSASGR